MRTRRVIWPLLSQYVVLPARSGSSGAGWTSPSAAVAREVTVCSPGSGVPQSKVQKTQANSSPCAVGQGRRLPRPVVDPDLDPGDGRAPGRAHDLVAVALLASPSPART